MSDHKKNIAYDGASNNTVVAMRHFLPAVVMVIALYLGGYAVVRVTHTHYWFDHRTEEKGDYTFFDTWSDVDMVLYRAFYPMLVLDLKVTGRIFEKDKW